MANAFDAATAWQTRNGIAGPFNLQTINQASSGDASGSGSTKRAGYTPPTPDTVASNSTNSSLPGNHGTQTVPHKFELMGGTKGNEAIATGVYYKLIPKEDNASKHPRLKTTPIWFPVTGDSPVDFTFTHQWDQADNLGKKFLGSVVNAAIGPDLGDLAFKQGQHLLGGGLYASGCAVYNSSAPPTISIATKLFSMGTGHLLKVIEDLRWESHPRRKAGGGSNVTSTISSAMSSLGVPGGDTAGGLLNDGAALANKAAEKLGGKAGFIDHPGWWDVEVISFAGGGAATVAAMTDMICTGLKVTMYSPWIGSEPSYLEIRMDFQHAYPGLAESMSFGG